MSSENTRKPNKLRTYTTQPVDRWYLGPSVNHYIFYTCYNIDTGGDTTPDTIAFFPEFMKMPSFSSRDMFIHADAYLTKAFQITHPESPFQLGDYQLKAIRDLANCFDAAIQHPNRDALPTPQLL